MAELDQIQTSVEPMLAHRFLVKFFQADANESTIKSEWVRRVKIIQSTAQPDKNLELTLTPPHPINVEDLDVSFVKIFYLKAAPSDDVLGHNLFKVEEMHLEIELDYGVNKLMEYKLTIKA